MLRAALIVILLLLPSAAHAAKRVALVVGNSAYQHTPALDNPKNDATDVVAALKRIGFTVVEGLDLTKSDFDRKVRDFSAALRGAEVGVFFYAGHGLQVAGHNYLVPIDAKLEDADALEWEMLRLDVVHRIMERQTSTNILFLDACRNNPLARNLARAMGTRSAEIGRGLAAVESGVGTLISFSTQPGNVALDGSGRNSPFAGSLVKRISSSHDDLSSLLIDVRNDVRKETENKQIPWEHSALTGRFYFNAAKQPAVPTPAPSGQSQTSEAERTWASIKDNTNQSVLEAFAKQFGDTVYGAMARARLEELKKQRVVPPPHPAAANPPAVSVAPEQKVAPVTSERSFKLASSFPSALTEVFEPSQQFVKEVQSASEGRLKVQLFAAGQITPGLQVLDSVINGSIELGWTVASFYVGKNPAFAAIAGSLPLGVDATKFVGWLEGSGRALRAGVYEEAGSVKAFPCSINGPKGLWVRKEVRSLEDLKGLKLRIQPPTSQAFLSTGVIPQQISAADIYPALEKGTIDGVEWMTPPMDEKLGWHKVAKYYYYPFGEPTFSTVSDLLINKRVWDELEPAAQAVIENACARQLRNDLGKLSDGVQGALQRMRAGGAVIAPTPEPIAVKYREGVSAYLDQNIKSSAGLAVWHSLKAIR